MFELNKVQRTKDGEMLKPFAVQGTMVLCADADGNTVKRPLSDFDFSTPKEKEVVSVQPTKNTKVIKVDEGKNNDGLFSEDIQDEDIYMSEAETEPEPESEPEPSAEPVSGPEQEPEQEPEPEPEPEPAPTKPGSIWDTLDDDDYL